MAMKRLVLLLKLRPLRCLLISLVTFLFAFGSIILTTLRDSHLEPEPSVHATVNIHLSEYEERLKRIQSVCRKYNLDTTPSVWKSQRHFAPNEKCTSEKCPLAVDETSRLLACLLPKVGCTTVKRYFLRVLHNETLLRDEPNELERFHRFADENLHRVTPSYYQAEELNTMNKFMIVRHPFERIVSAFVDKALKPRSTNMGFYVRYWIPIMKAAGRKVITNTTQPTFREFVHYLLRLPVDQYTEHWVPFWRRCEPCKVKYDFVAKLENADVDLPYAFSKHPVPDFPLVWNSGGNTSLKAKELFDELTASEVFALYTKYFLDFELFGYTIDEYIKGKDVRYM